MGWNYQGNLRGPAGPNGSAVGLFYEEYPLTTRTLANGWSTIPVDTSTAQMGAYAANRFSGAFYGSVPLAGLYSYQVTVATGAFVGGAGARLLLCCSSAALGAGTRWGVQEVDTVTAATQICSVTLTGRKWLTAGQSIYFSVYSSGPVVGQSATGLASIVLEQSF